MCWVASVVVTEGAGARSGRVFLVGLVGVLALLGLVLNGPAREGLSAAGSCDVGMGHGSGMSAHGPAGGSAAAASEPIGQDLDDGHGDTDSGCPFPMGLLAVCAGLLAVLVLAARSPRGSHRCGPALRFRPPRVVKAARSLGPPAPSLSELCVLRL